MSKNFMTDVDNFVARYALVLPGCTKMLARKSVLGVCSLCP